MVYVHQQKTKVLAIGEQPSNVQLPIMLRGQTLEQVESFPFLGSVVRHDSKAKMEVAVTVRKAKTVY